MRIKSSEVIILLTLSAVVAWDGIRLARRSAEHLRALEAGGYEILLGVVLAALTVLYWIREPGTVWTGGRGERYVTIAFGILVAYALLMPYLGYLLSSVLVVVVYMRVLGGYRWGFSLIFAVALAVSSAWLWAWLVIILPQGFFPWP